MTHPTIQRFRELGGEVRYVNGHLKVIHPIHPTGSDLGDRINRFYDTFGSVEGFEALVTSIVFQEAFDDDPYQTR